MERVVCTDQLPLGILQTPRAGRVNLWRLLPESLNGKDILEKLFVDDGKLE